MLQFYVNKNLVNRVEYYKIIIHSMFAKELKLLVSYYI